jgi:hypothetical protein
MSIKFHCREDEMLVFHEDGEMFATLYAPSPNHAYQIEQYLIANAPKETINPDDLHAIEGAQSQSALAMLQALRKKWPVGMRVECKLSATQKNPTLAEIVGQYGDGTLHIKLIRPRKRGAYLVYTYKNIHWTKIQ